MTPVTPVPIINDTNNSIIEEGIACSQTDHNEADHAFAHVTIIRLKYNDVF